VKRVPIWHLVTTVALLVAFVSQGTLALAGTTGGLTGVVIDASSNAPIAGARVSVTSPSQAASVTTDASGRFSFLTLAPDTYTVSVVRDNYQPFTVPGQAIFADTVQTVTARLQKTLSTIAHVTAVGSGSLVKSGTTADVYSVNAAGQNRCIRTWRRRQPQLGILGDRDRSRRLRRTESNGLFSNRTHSRR